NERCSGIDSAEDRLPVRVRAARMLGRAARRAARLPPEGDLLVALVRVAGDLVVRRTRDDVVLRVDVLLPRVDEVLVRERQLLAAPVPGRVRLDRVRQGLRRRRGGRDEILE